MSKVALTEALKYYCSNSGAVHTVPRKDLVNYLHKLTKNEALNRTAKNLTLFSFMIMYLYLLAIRKLHVRCVTWVNQIAQTGFEYKFKINWKPDAFQPQRKVTTELPSNKSEEGIIQLNCTFSLARYKSSKFTEGKDTVENQGCLCGNELHCKWRDHLTTNIILQEKLLFPSQYLTVPRSAL